MAGIHQAEVIELAPEARRSTSLTAWIKKIHMYLGLLNFSILLVFGIAGVTASFHSRQPPSAVEQFVPFTPPVNVNDKQLADAVYSFLKLPLTAPIPKPGLNRGADNNLLLNFYTPNGVTRVAVLEKANQLRVRSVKYDSRGFLNSLHTATVQHASAQTDLRMRLWTYYNEFSIWSLLAMAISGVYLWLASRLGYRLAQYALAGGCGAFVVLYMVTR